MKGYKAICLFVPEDLFKRFKIQLVKEDLTMKKVLIEFIQEYTKEVKSVKSKKNSTKIKT